MKYCSECGSPIKRRWVAEERRERFVCSACGTTHYENPRVIVNCVVHCGEQVLMCRRAQEPGIGQWAVPMGYLECGETLQECAAREVFEEAGVIIDPRELDLCAVLNMPAIEQIAVSFRITVKSKPLIRPRHECLEVAFLTLDEIPPRQFAWYKSMGTATREFSSELGSGSFSIYLVRIGSKDGRGFESRRYKITPPCRSVSTLQDHDG